jgi:hypothetical protein
MPLRLPIGISDFRKLREQRAEYIDKSHLIIELLDQSTEVLLLPRPRRFGKTLNLTMLRYFFERTSEDLSHLFADLAVWRAGDAYRDHFQRYPVIYLTFRDVKQSSFEQCWADLTKKIQTLFGEHKTALLDSGVLEEWEARDFKAILDGTAEPVLYRRALGDLSKYLHRATGEHVILLIDEYDQPIHAGYVHGYSQEIIEFCRAFLTLGLKDNPHLERGVITGILRIARESIFSGLNNLGVFTLLEPRFATAFGFTETEVHDLLTRAGKSDALPEVQRWYNGYRFAGHVIYNPWSVLNFVHRKRSAQPYWLSTSDNALIKHLLERHASRVHGALEELMAGGSVLCPLDENVVLDQLEQSEDALWSLLVFSGYLNAEEQPRQPGASRSSYRLTIPNMEVRLVYTDTFRDWMRGRLYDQGGDLRRLIAALLGGDAEAFEDELQALARAMLSYHDTGGARPENLYHGFVLGLLAVLEPEHAVRSNRESGEGRPDVLITPRQPGKPGVVLELKVARPGRKTLEQALDEGMRQLEEGDYPAELRASGAAPVHALVVAFDGKDVRVRSAPAPGGAPAPGVSKVGPS